MHITITGNLGSGKSTICKILEDKYGFEIYSTGKVQREIAKEMNITTLEMNQLMCSDRKYDTMIDDATARISRENRDKNIIFDSRLAWHFVEQSFKVFLSVSLNVAAERVKNDDRGNVEKYSSIAEAKEMLAARAETEDKRYKDMYHLNYFDFSNYNLVIDSTCCTPEKIASIIMQEAKKFEATMKEKGAFESGNQGINRILISPKRLYPHPVLSEELNNLKGMIDEYAKLSDYIETTIPVSKNGDEYMILDGLDQVKAAAAAEVPFIPVIIN
ncbi:dephospho-CoA kinase [Anaerocolumna sedimenticola]|uniref:Dephospho-CoA kinase n=1 Tax=Anaerocolumna sedimenticola TaxID=2696063 RepID=A0A6P1TGV5_9FIRM|nr:cytidylate kinase family protein [Anaerocolumna sedimenticola]QHQ60384.1 dephospho-CoA kinase [Anaerocolumna sedimenticola]